MPIFLLRHGESLHNVEIKAFIARDPRAAALEWWEIEDIFDPGLRDADLTPLGSSQARNLRQEIVTLNPSLLVLSPLTRNLRTAYESCHDLIHGHVPPEVFITPLAREHTYSTCDLGSTPSELMSAWPFWRKQLSSIPDLWWMHNISDDTTFDLAEPESYREPWARLQERVQELISYIRLQTKNGRHENVLLVGHAVLFYAITGDWLDNCQLVELDLTKLREPCQCSGYACEC